MLGACTHLLQLFFFCCEVLNVTETQDADFIHSYVFIYTHCWELLNSVVSSHSNLSLLFMIKVKV